jgi:hypothetical protein
MTAILPFRVQHASTNPEKARRAVRKIERSTGWRMRVWRVKRWFQEPLHVVALVFLVVGTLLVWRPWE